MSNTPASLTTPLEDYREWLADLKGRINNIRATAPSWRKNHSD